MKEQIDTTIETISGLRDGIKADSMMVGITPKMLAPLIAGVIAGGEPVELASQFTANFTSRHADTIPVAVKDGSKLAKQILKEDGVPDA